MKTSTKIIIAGFTLLVVAMAMYNYKLRLEYLKGNITFPYIENNQLFFNAVERRLPKFKYLVVNGAIITKETKITSFMPTIEISGNMEDKNSIYINERLDKIVKTDLRGDTLNISFQKEKVNSKIKNDYFQINHFGAWMVLKLSDIRGVKGNNARFQINSLTNKSSFSFKFGDNVDNIRITNISTPDLHLETVQSTTTLAASSIKNLHYTLLKGADLNIENTNDVKNYIAVNPENILATVRTQSMYITGK